MSDGPGRFIIATLAHTGSTTLIRLMNCNPEIHCLFEPFNPANLDRYPGQPAEEGLAAGLAWVWERCNGFKHVWHGNGWPFNGRRELNDELLSLPGVRIIVLARRNMLRRAISVELSEQMKIWQISSDEERRRVRAHKFEPLDLGKLRAEIVQELAARERARGILAKRGKEAREVWYEDIFEGGIDGRVELVQSLMEFVGAGRLLAPQRVALLRGLLNPAVSGFQNAEYYYKIPNIEEVEKELGSDETGHVSAGMDF